MGGAEDEQRLREEMDAQRRCIQSLKFIKEEEITCMEVIGQGAFGTVLKGRWGDRDVAVKKLQHDMSLEAEATFFSEVEIHNKMRHENVVVCLGALKSKAVVLEMAKCNLRQYLTSCGPNLDLISKVDLMLSASAGLKYLHDSKVVHRDIKSGNFLVF